MSYAAPALAESDTAVTRCVACCWTDSLLLHVLNPAYLSLSSAVLQERRRHAAFAEAAAAQAAARHGARSGALEHRLDWVTESTALILLSALQKAAYPSKA